MICILLKPNTALDHVIVVHSCVAFTSWFLKMWLFPYPYGFCNPVQIYGKKINDMIWCDVIWCDMWYDVIWYDIIYDVMWCDIWYDDMIWCDIIWYIRYDVMWYDMICDIIWYDAIWYIFYIWYDMWYNDMIYIYMIYDMIITTMQLCTGTVPNSWSLTYWPPFVILLHAAELLPCKQMTFSAQWPWQ